jgi:3-hydroxyisobutyrate dehydrogenase
MSAALPLTIGFIGLGVMGVPMARHLSEACHRVQGFDVAASALQRLQREVPQARPCADARSAAADADVVFTMLPNGRVVHDVVCAADGVAAGLRAGALLVDTSSSEPWLTRQSAAALQARGASPASWCSWSVAPRPTCSARGRCSMRWAGRCSTSDRWARGTR